MSHRSQQDQGLGLENIKTQTINRQECAEIWEDKGDVSMSVNIQAGEWFNAESLQRFQSGAQGDSIAEHASVIWQDFDVAMTIPEAYYDDRHYWFKMDTYASTNSNYYTHTQRKAYFCNGCIMMKSFSQANVLGTGNGDPNICIGCAHTSALKL